MSNYTKGPWHIGSFENTKYLKVYATNDDLELICNVCEDKILHGRTQDYMANAKLIAAAPDLLEALLKLQDVINRAAAQNCVHAIETDEVNMINAAILKAVQS